MVLAVNELRAMDQVIEWQVEQGFDCSRAPPHRSWDMLGVGSWLSSPATCVFLGDGRYSGSKLAHFLSYRTI